MSTRRSVKMVLILACQPTEPGVRNLSSRRTDTNGKKLFDLLIGEFFKLFSAFELVLFMAVPWMQLCSCPCSGWGQGPGAIPIGRPSNCYYCEDAFARSLTSKANHNRSKQPPQNTFFLLPLRHGATSQDHSSQEHTSSVQTLHSAF